MAIPATICNYLDSLGIEYTELQHAPTDTLQQAAEASGIPMRDLARAVVLRSDKGLYMAVLPASHILDFEAICARLQCYLEPASRGDLGEIFTDCEPGSYPPVAEAYGLQAIVDDSIAYLDGIYFEPGSHSTLVHVPREQVPALYRDALHGNFARSTVELIRPEFDMDEAVAPRKGALEQFAPMRIKQRIEEIHDLPAIPDVAVRILDLRREPRADATDLAKVVELDPGLAAQVVRYATSPFYGYRGKIESVRDAISRVLGFDMVMNMALGIAIGRSLRIPPDGPLGLKAFWRHALYSAVLSEGLAQSIADQAEVKPGIAYLSGLLHNFGHLLLGHVFKPGFFLLNKFVSVNPGIPVTDIETHVLGVRHDQIGSWLMRSWQLPEEIGAAVRWHHDETYVNEHCIYPQLVMVADRYLKRRGIGDAPHGKMPASVLTQLGLSEDRVESIATRVLGTWDGLDSLAGQLAA